MTRGLITLLLCLLLSCHDKSSNIKIDIVDGKDWSLPEYIEPTPNTGFSWIWGDWKWVKDWQKIYPLSDANCLYFAEYIIFDWADVNPSPEVYDFSSIDSKIDSILRDSIPGLGFALWPRIYSRSVIDEEKLHGTGTFNGDPMLPLWLEDFSLINDYPVWMTGTREVKYLNDGAIAAWIPNSVFLPALNQLLDTLGRKYKDHPKLAWVECRYNDSHWGEGGFRSGKEEISRAEELLELNLNNYKTFMLNFIDIWEKAFKGQERKIVLNDWSPTVPGLPDKYEPVQQDILQYAIKKGLGGRDGQVEVWNRYISSGYGNVLNPDGYLIFDDDYPPVKEGRVWYTENEAYIFPGPRKTFGPAEYEEYRWFTSSMRLLQMRRNWEWIKKEACFKWPEITRYVQLSLGKLPQNSPDGFCYLREGYTHAKEFGREGRAVKNFERWLLQRDIEPDGITTPALKFDLTGLHQWASARGYEYMARSTNINEGQNSLYFKTDENWFGDYKGPVKLFVTYLDSGESVFHILYRGKNKQSVTPSVKVQNSGTWKTAIFKIPEFKSDSSFNQNMDFKIVVTGNSDVVFQLVRLVKWDDN